MKNWQVSLVILFNACVWREPKQDVCHRSESLDEIVELTIAVSDPPWGGHEATNEAALRACRMWESIGISCSIADSLENADIYIDFYSDWDCKNAGFVGTIGDFHGKRPGIWLNGANICFPSEGVREWFVHVVAHEIGHMLGIDDVPGFCGNAIMNPAIERLQPTTFLAAITEIDLHAFLERNSHSLLLSGNAVLDCETEETSANAPAPVAEEVDTEPLVTSIWIEPELLPWSAEIMDGCSWWAPVHFSCVLASSRQEAEIIVREFKSDACGIAGFTYYDWTLFDGRYAVEINIDCMPGSGSASNWTQKVAAHEIAHTQGVGHVPFFCGDAVMNLYLTSRTSISSIDVSAWQERYENYLK